MRQHEYVVSSAYRPPTDPLVGDGDQGSVGVMFAVAVVRYVLHVSVVSTMP